MIFRRQAATPLPEQPECGEVARVLQSFIDGELGPDDADKVADHLEFCERCNVESRIVNEVVATIRRQAPALDRDRLERLERFVDELADDPAT